MSRAVSITVINNIAPGVTFEAWEKVFLSEKHVAARAAMSDEDRMVYGRASNGQVVCVFFNIDLAAMGACEFTSFLFLFLITNRFFCSDIYTLCSEWFYFSCSRAKRRLPGRHEGFIEWTSCHPYFHSPLNFTFASLSREGV